ncbi:hypothetical protein ACFS3C_13785 [Azotobacter vinelandii]
MLEQMGRTGLARRIGQGTTEVKHVEGNGRAGRIGSEDHPQTILQAVFADTVALHHRGGNVSLYGGDAE